MKFKKKAVIFDLDGVICFTDKFHYQAWKARLGIYFDEKINDRLRGVSRMASLDIILERSDKEYTQKEKEAFATEKNDTYRELLKNMSPADLTDEARDTLVELRKRGYKLSIGSSSKNTKFIFAQYHVQLMIPAHDNRMSIGAKGLSGKGYKGHTFWDTEIFLLPYFIFNMPEVARSLEEYRYLSLPGAHAKAAHNGYGGTIPLGECVAGRWRGYSRVHGHGHRDRPAHQGMERLH